VESQFDRFLPCSKCQKPCRFTTEFAYDIAKNIFGFKCSKCAGERYRGSKYDGKGLMKSLDGSLTWIRNCPKCSREITHIGANAKENCISSIRKKRLCKKCANVGRWSEEKRKQFSESRRGDKNPNWVDGLGVTNPFEYNRRYRELNRDKIRAYKKQYYGSEEKENEPECSTPLQ